MAKLTPRQIDAALKPERARPAFVRGKATQHNPDNLLPKRARHKKGHREGKLR